MENKEIAELAKKLQNLIEVETATIKYTNTKWESKYNDVISELEYDINNTKNQLEEFKEEVFTVNRIELEGYLRGLTTTLNTLNFFKPNKE